MTKKLGLFLLFVLGVAISTFLSVNLISTSQNIDLAKNPFAVQINTLESPMPSAAPRQDIAEISENVLPSVVGVSSAAASSEAKNSLFDYFSSNRPEWSTGSGVVVSGRGYILTNWHVLGKDPLTVEITVEDKTNLTGKVVWGDQTLDLALIKVNYNALKAAPIGAASDLKVGDRLIAIGNPLGRNFSRTVTAGIVSALGRSVEVETGGVLNFMEGLIQTDASINPGNSGGPLIDINGRVIGINTVKVAAAEGVGFAVPIDYVKPVIDSFEKNEKYDTPYLGFYGIDESKGIKVLGVDKDGPFAKSEIKENEIITSIAGEKITTLFQLRKKIYTLSPGQTYNATVLSGGLERNVSVTPVAKGNSGGINR